MRKLLQKVDRIRATGMATLKLEPDSPHYKLNGKKIKVSSLGVPD